ncbi:hypothetical protein M2375_000631 [Comamonas sp. BIGb0152]|uniref:arginase family protein n=1 Tax=Comamonas sp. BIGb0152 TaxID=2940601 RepID=UPI00216886F1|nr:arginase family protein [Comamonas sp. BIGb0152]MCS4292436.1 hypothetical protein [Comamonas sp. BIGb0152]
MKPLVLDVDGSVGPLAGELRLPLGDWQDAIRFGASLGVYQRFSRHVQAQLPAQHGTAWMGSGDFHHLSWLLITHCIARQGFTAARPLRVVVLDNHPDNMRFPWGVHCGSWVRRIAMHPAVSHVHVAGITSQDIGAGHAWENYLGPLRAGKLSYWSCGVDTGWARRLGMAAAFRAFDSMDGLVDALTAVLATARESSYLSIDKDVFAPDVVTTNWDQGQMREAQALRIMAALGGQLVGSDVTGDISSWRYATWWKRWLSAGDGQDTAINAQTLAQAQAGQHAFNQRLMAALSASTRPATGQTVHR